MADYSEFDSFFGDSNKSSFKSETGDNTFGKSDDNSSPKPNTHKVFSIVLDEDGRLIVKDKDLNVLDLGDIRGPKGDDGYVDPVIKEGKLYFRNKKGDIFTSGGNVKGEDGISYEPVLDEQTGQLRFKNSKTGELRPGGFDIKGKDGENGKTFEPRVSPDGKYLFFVDGDGKEIPGQYLIKGKDGENGKEYIPHISDDGTELFFTDGEGVEIPGRYPVKGAEGKPGISFYPEVDKDGYLSWRKVDGETILSNPPTPKKIKGEQGEPGITYRPFVKDGVLYWCDDKGNLVDDLDPARIRGDRGETGKEGPRGLSAYQIWLKQGYKGTEQDFLDFLKGEKGEPAPPANFSFKDVEDWTCPVQMIDTNLIVDSEKGKDSPEKIIEDRIKEIEDLREMGRERRNRSWFRFRENCKRRKDTNGATVETKKSKKNTEKLPKANRVGLLKEIAWWCAGADKDLLAMCPGDHTKYVGIGTVILFTALMAWFSSFIAMQLVFPKQVVSIRELQFNWAAALFATFWSAMIFCLDRFITNTMYSDGKVTISRKEFMSGLPRIIIAIFLGIVISAPLELMIFNDRIELEIDNQKDKEKNEKKEAELIASNKRFKEATENLQNDKSNYEQQLKRLQEELEAIPDKPDEKTELKPIMSVDSTGKQIITDYTKILLNKKDIDAWNNDHRAHYNKVQGLISQTNDKIIEIDSLISGKGVENAKLDTTNVSMIDTTYSAKFDDGLLRKLRVLHEIALEGKDVRFKWWFHKEKTLGHSWEDIEPEKGRQFFSVLLSPLNFLFWLISYIVIFLFTSPIGLIMLLFILIDISPVLYKMMLADGKYDNYLHQEKLLAQDKIRLSLAKMLKKLDEGELKRVSPFIMGDAYGKMAKDAYSYVNIEGKNKGEKDIGTLDDVNVRGDYAAYYQLLMKEYQKRTGWRRVFPLSLVEWFIIKKKDEPIPPRIEFEKNKSDDSQADQSQANANASTPSEPQKPKAKKNKEEMSVEKLLEDTNRDVFEEVLDMKKKIILASYRRWYKTQHDCIICDDIEDENKRQEPFDDDALKGDDTKIHIDDDKGKEKFSYDDFNINMDTEDEEEPSKADVASNQTSDNASHVEEDAEEPNEGGSNGERREEETEEER